jgi:hypothetical protein
MNENVSVRDHLKNDGLLMGNDPSTINIYHTGPGEKP